MGLISLDNSTDDIFISLCPIYFNGVVLDLYKFNRHVYILPIHLSDINININTINKSSPDLSSYLINDYISCYSCKYCNCICLNKQRLQRMLKHANFVITFH